MTIRHFLTRFLLLALPSTINIATGAPVVPRASVDTTLPTSSYNCTVFLTTSSALQLALNNARLGDTICLQAGAVFTGNFVLPRKTVGSGWITVRTSTPESSFVQPGSRVGPTNASSMARVQTATTDPAFVTEPAAHHYRLIGLEITGTSSLTYNLVLLDSRQYPNRSSLSVTPTDIVIDRCYLHGEPTTTARRAVMINSSRSAVVDSYLSDLHEVGADSQGILGYNAPGPLKIQNNYIEASGENIMFGGAGSDDPSLDPSDIEVLNNHLFKPFSWRIGDPSYAGIPWTVKNLFELKNAHRVLVSGNVMDNNWLDAQNGGAVLFQGLPSDSGLWATVDNVTFRNNIVRHATVGVTICGNCIYLPAQSTDPSALNYADPSISRVHDIAIANNLFLDLNWTQYGRPGGTWGAALLMSQNVTRLSFTHNTVMNANLSSSIWFGAGPSEQFVATDNIMYHSVGGDGAINRPAVDLYAPGSSIYRNVLIDTTRAASFPDLPDNFSVDGIGTLGFVDSANGNYRLSNTSPFKNAATDGHDIGADMNELAGASTGPGTIPAPPTFSPPAGVYASTQSVTISTTTAGAVVRYTTDGSIPSASVGSVYSGPITVSNPTIVRALVYGSGLIDSPVVSASYSFSAGNLPSADSVSPNSGSGASQEFTFVFSDTQNPANLTGLAMLFATSVTSTNVCYLVYDRNQGSISLLWDSGTGSNSKLITSVAILQNSQCQVSTTSITTSGLSIILKASITFKGTFAGLKSIFMYASKGALNTGWVNKGTFNSTANTTTGGVPTADSVVPASGSGRTQRFSFQVSDLGGSSYIAGVAMLLSTSLSTLNACSVVYDRGTNTLSLGYENPANGSTPLTVGSNNVVSNNQCSLYGVNSTVVIGATAIVVTLDLTFSATFFGAKNIYLYAGEPGVNTGYVLRGSWTVTSGSPTADSVSPVSGAGTFPTFVFTVSDPSGASNISGIGALFTTGPPSIIANACNVLYNRSNATIGLYADDGITLSTKPIGSSAALQNTQCAIGYSAPSTSGNSVSILVQVLFKTPVFDGAKSVYVQANEPSISSGWTLRGSWTVK